MAIKRYTKVLTEFQPILWLIRDSTFADTSIIMPEFMWLITEGFRRLHLRTHLLYMNGTQSLYIETCDTPDGNWETMSSYSSGGSATPTDEFFTADRPKSDYQRMRKFVRWRWTGFSGNAEMCLRMKAVLKK